MYYYNTIVLYSFLYTVNITIYVLVDRRETQYTADNPSLI